MKKEKKINKAKLLKKLKKELWELCKIYVRKRDGRVCFTCGKKGLEGGNQHTGHCLPSCICPFELDYYPYNLAVQCYFCNIHAGGNGGIFLTKIENKFGGNMIRKLFMMLNAPRITEPTIEDYQAYIDKYKQLIKDLKCEHYAI